MLLEDYPKDDTEMLCERCGVVCKKPQNNLKDIFICFNCTIDLMYKEQFASAKEGTFSPKPLKEAFCKLISDKSIPLDDRWNLFCKAPSYMKNSEPWIQHFDCIDIMADESEPIYAAKYQTLYTETMVEDLERSNYEEYSNKELINTFKEEVLAKNLYSYVMDW